jgi:dTMP kinase
MDRRTNAELLLARALIHRHRHFRVLAAASPQAGYRIDDWMNYRPSTGLSSESASGLSSGSTNGLSSGSPKFVAVEGIDGAGTTSQIEALRQRLVRQGYRIHVTAEPSAGAVGRLIREQLARVEAPPAPATLALLFAADRLDHLQSDIEPALARGEHVLSDRYVLSSLVYQGLNNPLPWVRTINQAARPPDLTVLFQIDPNLAAARRRGRGGAEEIYDLGDIQQRLAARYEELAEGLPEHGIVRLDATPGFDQVTDAFEEVVRGCLGAP